MVADGCLAELAEIIKFADDTKTYRTVENDNDRKKLQTVLDRLCTWASKWGMEFNTKKCKVMHIGKNNKKFQYTMNGNILETTEEERDLGVIIDNTLKPSAQCRKAATKARVVLGQITRNFTYRDKKHFLSLYTQYVRPHLEFASPAWAPWTTTDKQVLEKVQEQALRLTHGLKSTTYEERCKEAGLETLETRRKHQDLMQVFKILKGIDKVDPDKLFSKVSHSVGTRNAADPMNLQKKRARREIWQNSFGIRVVDSWNGLPREMKNSEKPATLKNFLKKKLA